MGRDESTIRHALERLDWDFQGALSSYGVHKLHWYPGTFVPQIPAYLIELLSQPRELVYDPFCGAGTTLVEAVRLGRSAIGSDLNEIGVLVARAKTCVVAVDEIRTQLATFLSRLENERIAYGLFGGEASLHRKGINEDWQSRFRPLSPWYHEATFEELLLVRRLIDGYSDPFALLLTVAFSQIVKGASSSRHWGWVADNVRPKVTEYAPAIQAFTRALSDVVDACIEASTDLGRLGTSRNELNSRSLVIRADLLGGSPVAEGTVDLIVTSPPYINVTDYTTAQRLSMQWLGLDMAASKEREIGARWKRFRQRAVKDYLREMDACLRSIVATLRRGRYACLVLGEGQHKKERVHSIGQLCESMKNAGAPLAFSPIIRRLSRQRVRSRDGISGVGQVLIFKKT